MMRERGFSIQRGFTLIELSLAMTIGALALILAGGVFYSVGLVDQSSERSHRVRAESYIAQTVLRNTFMSVMVEHGGAMDSKNPPDISGMGRARIILEKDPAINNAFQRLEIVLRSTPVPGVLQGPAARLAFADEDAMSLNFASANGAGGSARCVFELRPDGERESVMRRLGIENPMSDMTGIPDPENASGDRGWSLWWRRMTADEVETLEAGYLPWADGNGDPDSEARRLASSVRLASGLRDCIWKMYHRDKRKEEFLCYTNGDLPAYAMIELADFGAEYSNWMFEIGWAYGKPEDIEIADGGPTGSGAPSGGSGGSTGGQPPNRGGSNNLLKRQDRIEP